MIGKVFALKHVITTHSILDDVSDFFRAREREREGAFHHIEKHKLQLHVVHTEVTCTSTNFYGKIGCLVGKRKTFSEGKVRLLDYLMSVYQL